MSKFQPSGIVTLTTDFGHKGPFAAVMCGVIYQRFRGATIIDLAHDIPAHWPPEAGFWIRRSYRYFPSGTVHIAIVDPGVGTEREIILADHAGHIFIAPDNGLLDTLLREESVTSVYSLDFGKLNTLGISDPSPTFHGRDIFAPVAAELAAGRLQITDVANEIQQWAPSWIDETQVVAGKAGGVVVSIDAFGNLITNIDGRLVAGMTNPVVSIAGHKLEIKTTYGRAEPGQFLALINSFGVVEIARAEGNAAEGLGVERGAPVTVNGQK